ncbi:MAG: hypothetical protein FJ276_16440 [Planctomycetes bacterium]|nr:hypothetical protein [Planctomycetota bacterium]
MIAKLLGPFRLRVDGQRFAKVDHDFFPRLVGGHAAVGVRAITTAGQTSRHGSGCDGEASLQVVPLVIGTTYFAYDDTAAHQIPECMGRGGTGTCEQHCQLVELLRHRRMCRLRRPMVVSPLQPFHAIRQFSLLGTASRQPLFQFRSTLGCFHAIQEVVNLLSDVRQATLGGRQFLRNGGLLRLPGSQCRRQGMLLPERILQHAPADLSHDHSLGALTRQLRSTRAGPRKVTGTEQVLAVGAAHLERTTAMTTHNQLG